ncbi:hypothetical protein A1O3_03376 [Capronia epimyces CBS 606.96]|uniref:Uncharacterized protein n=1 Tax=Capronia epimyces CBS 606.96 TaxID=1182542 RepID=W9Y9X0_9EURO|nr:uncharacterized protein A1O3_03376 [Capronia epimyces CBS 606.96]EXJ86425.1 hypothetical protein A1O3_03376 [Capronia epimyces CBS 606.96]
MATSYLGLGLHTSSTTFAGPAAFLAWNWFYAYCVLASRTLKQWHGIDHNGNPRQDINKYGAAAIREGKLTQAQLEQIQRMEAASANSVEGYTFFAASVLLALVANVPRPTLTAACTTYTIARLVYGAVYVLIPHDLYSQLRGIAWWTGNTSCLFLLWKAARSSVLSA